MIKLAPTASIPGTTAQLFHGATVTRFVAAGWGAVILNELQSAGGQFNEPQEQP